MRVYFVFCAKALVFVTVAFLTACNSVSGTGSNVANQSADNFILKPPKPGFGVAYIGRPMTRRTSIFAVQLEVDGKPVASVGFNQYARVELPVGHHEIAAVDNFWSRAINGVPHPVALSVEAGKAYYLLPTRWAGESRMTFTLVNGMAIPEQTAVGHSSFSVQTSLANAVPPAAFRELSPSNVEQ